MGTYIQIDDVRGRLKGDFESLYKLPDEQVDLDADIAAAESQVNLAVSRQTDPATLPEADRLVLKTLALDLFAERAWGRGEGDEIPKKVESLAKLAREHLADFAAGKSALGSAAAEAAVVVSGNAPDFTREQMEGF